MPVSIFSRLTHRLGRIGAGLLAACQSLFRVTTSTSTVVPPDKGGSVAAANGVGPGGVDGTTQTGTGAANETATAAKSGVEPDETAPGVPIAGAATMEPEEVHVEPPARIRILDVQPSVDGGRFDVKRTVGDAVTVSAEAFRDGHEVIRAVVRYRPPGGDWAEAPMAWIDRDVDGDRWAGTFAVDREGIWAFEVGAFTDHFATWHDEVARKRAAGGEDLSSEVVEGAELLRAAAERVRVETGTAAGDQNAAPGDGTALGRAGDEILAVGGWSDAVAGPDGKAVADLNAITDALEAVESGELDIEAKLDRVLDAELLAAVERHPDRRDFVTGNPLSVAVERERARFGAWYELFPRSWGGFDGVREQLPRLAELGFDVVYLPPIHPIGHTNRKGANNALTAGPDDPGSPWSIGSELGGHEAIDPGLGDAASFEALVEAAREVGIEIALDFALNCSADHPWLKEHPEWFNHRPDGTIKYAENPPKRYQDIYNLNFDSEDWRGLWEALRDVVALWVERGVRIFRVDNPHTKPLPFWEWLITDIRATHPDVIFLSEAFTRRAKLMALAKLGFSQSYTYFTWKNSRWELTEYVNELAYVTADYCRPNFFANTPDILTEYLVGGGPPAFEARLVLAATLSPTYGIYSGFENFENIPAAPGSEEYMDSEKYQLRERRLYGPLLPMVQKVNAARRENPALQHLSNITFLDTENEALIAYAKRTGDNTVITVVSLDPHHTQEGIVNVIAELGTPPAFKVLDLLDEQAYDWSIGRNYVRLAPGHRMAHVMRVER